MSRRAQVAAAAARVVGRFLVRHRLLSAVAMVLVLTAVVGLAAWSVQGVGSGQTLPGTTAPGSHQYTSLADMAGFCNNCHSGIQQELASSWGEHQGWSCAQCHAPQAGGHATSPAQCANCHGEEAGEVDSSAEVHRGMLVQLGETAGTASWTCKACHTYVETTLTPAQDPPLSPGSTAPGSHQWLDPGQSAFCERCHGAVHPLRTGAGAPYEGWACASCHGASGGAHAASPPPNSDLSVVKVDSPDPVDAGANLTYFVTVTNLGPDPAAAVVLTDTLPAGVTLLSVTPSQGSCAGATCQLGDIQPQDSASVSFIVLVDAGTAGIITNTACTTSASADPDAANDCASVDTMVIGLPADLAVAKADSPDPVQAGANLTYSVTVTNLGPNVAPGVVLTDTLPAGVTLLSATPSQGTCAGTTCQLGDILAQGSASVSFVVQVDVGTLGTVTNSACASSLAADPDSTNDCASADTTVNPPP